MKVMIVDDEEFIRMGLVKILGKLELDIEVVASCANGMEAIGAIEKLGGSEIDVMITDIKMPVMDGLKLIEHISNRWPELHTIVLSGFNEFEYARKAMRYGVKDYLLKPIDKFEMYETLKKAKLELGEACEQRQPEVATQQQDSQAVELMKSHLEREYGKPFELEELAASLGFNGSYLSRMFREKTGITLTDYLIKVRIEKAKQYLDDHPQLKNYEISEIVGYSDPVYFNKLFKKITGLTPKEYRDRKAD